MEYIKIPKNICIDYIPNDGILCERCTFNAVCPYDFECQSIKRTEKYTAIQDEEL